MDLNIKENVIFHTILKYTGWVNRGPHFFKYHIWNQRILSISYVAINYLIVTRVIYPISNPKYCCVKLIVIHHSTCKIKILTSILKYIYICKHKSCEANIFCSKVSPYSKTFWNTIYSYNQMTFWEHQGLRQMGDI